MIFEKMALDGIILIRSKVFYDRRGSFREISRESELMEAGIKTGFVQINTSTSAKGVIRGMHYQINNPQSKLVSVAHGRIYDVVLDCRIGSPQFGKWVGVELSAEGGEELFIPGGFAHGFQALADNTAVIYQCDRYYVKSDENGVNAFSESLGIDWRNIPPILSDKDQVLPDFSNADYSAFPVYTPRAQ